MNLILDFLDGLWTKLKARRAGQAAADLARGQEIIDAAEAEAREMDAARKELDATLSATPATPAPPAAPPVAAPAATPAAPPPVPAEPRHE